MTQTLSYTKPLPIVTPVNKPFWDAAKRHELVLPRCKDCGAWTFPLGPMCQSCWSENLEWARASGRGVVTTWVVFHRAFDPSFTDDIPYAVVQVELEEGVRYISNLVGVAPNAIKPGMRVEAVFDDVTPEISLLKFRPA